MAPAARRALPVIGVGILTFTAFATPALAKGPRIMIVYGTPLGKPVVIANWQENGQLMMATNDAMSVPYARLAGRPSLRVAMFWGERWVLYMKSGKSPTALRVREADQFARLYPAYRGAPALFVFDNIPGPYTSLIRRIGPAGLTVLARHGIPVRLPR